MAGVKQRADVAGAAIRARRQELGMSQDELASIIGVDRRSVGAWETGQHFPTRHQAKIEAALGLQLGRVLENLTEQELLGLVRQLSAELTAVTAELERREGQADDAAGAGAGA